MATRGAVHWAVSDGKVMTTPASSLDGPIPRMVEQLKAGDTEPFFPVHRADREVESVHAETMVVPDNLPTPGSHAAPVADPATARQRRLVPGGRHHRRLSAPRNPGRRW